MGIRTWLRNWLLTDSLPTVARGKSFFGGPVGDVDEHEAAQGRKMKIQIQGAVNGHIVTIARHLPQKHGPDWIAQNYIVADAEELFDTIKAAIATSILEEK